MTFVVPTPAPVVRAQPDPLDPLDPSANAGRALGGLGRAATSAEQRGGGSQPVAPLSTVVLDTSVLIADPAAMVRYEHAAVVVPLVVIEELDALKTRLDHVGHAAREALRTVEELRVANNGDLRSAVPLTGTSTFRIMVGEADLAALATVGLDRPTPDNQILAMCASLMAHDAPVRLLSNDTALRIKAAHLGLEVAPHTRVDLAPGGTRDTSDSWPSVEIGDELLSRLFRAGSFDADDVIDAGLGDDAVLPLRAMRPNEFGVVRSGTSSALVRRTAGHHTLLSTTIEAYGLRPRSKEQRAALTLLLDPEVSVVALDGVAGTGKTLLALAAGLEQVVERHALYERLAIYRPIIAVGRADLGYLPGSVDEKLEPWMSAIVDAISALTDDRSFVSAQMVIDELLERGQMTMESVTFLRGRTLQQSFIVVDEAQNLEPATVKTILTRVGAGAKIVFCGDCDQIDAPYLSKHNNGLAVLIDAFRGQSCFGGVRLVHCERSAVAALAAQLL